ncbi:MAG: ABC transporter substrate-binding protein [Caldisphaeraceae archaeon]|nr:ABC transporter substrate-binding protein [Caldisphaeraceae archaeon]MEB3692098.1 ABC transporter substrate-binding protein [Caldisphaeraceae archaeon]MEB3797880.1 ABC transporter substrate-binding protein [Caldisphaeraceae archaeon]
MVKLYSEILSKEIEVADELKRIVSLAPAITETLYLIGAGDKVVGVSYFCNKPAEVAKKPRVGAYLNVNYDLLQKLNPEILLVTTGAQRERIYELENNGYKIYPIALPVNIYGILDNIMVVGIIVGERYNARALAYEMNKKMISLHNALNGTKLYYEINLGGPVSVGAHSYIGDAFSYIGASHVFEKNRTTYITNPDIEDVKRFDPEIIIYEQKLGEHADKKKVKEKLEKRGLGNLNAVKEGRIIVMEYDSLAHYGPSFFDALQRLVKRVNDTLTNKY